MKLISDYLVFLIFISDYTYNKTMRKHDDHDGFYPVFMQVKTKALNIGSNRWKAHCQELEKRIELSGGLR